MDFFEKMSEELNHMGNGLVKATKETAENARLRANIANEKNKLLDLYRLMGEKLYEQYHNDKETLSELGDVFVATSSSIDAEEKKIRQLREELAMLKGGAFCPDCGAVVERGASYCQECGCDLKDR